MKFATAIATAIFTVFSFSSAVFAAEGTTTAPAPEAGAFSSVEETITVDMDGYDFTLNSFGCEVRIFTREQFDVANVYCTAHKKLPVELLDLNAHDRDDPDIRMQYLAGGQNLDNVIEAIKLAAGVEHEHGNLLGASAGTCDVYSAPIDPRLGTAVLSCYVSSDSLDDFFAGMPAIDGKVEIPAVVVDGWKFHLSNKG